tara:strand:+ start:549 stop:1316 length:768 start_codon:yes stop_codon:yes gene_type:complete
MDQSLIDYMQLTDGMTKRMDCPKCRGRGTMTVTCNAGMVIWNCYKAACTTRGAAPVTMTRAAMETRLAKSDVAPNTLTYTRPANFSSYLPPKMIQYMQINNVAEAWNKKWVEMHHDVAQDRAVFVIKSGGKSVDAVGRALGKGRKWHRYQGTGEPFLCGQGDPLYIVEDAASACAVAEYGTGMALLGTSLTDRAVEIAKTYQSVVVCLDKDAVKKALTMVSRLKQFMPASMRVLDLDPKEKPEGVLNDNRTPAKI